VPTPLRSTVPTIPKPEIPPQYMREVSHASRRRANIVCGGMQEAAPPPTQYAGAFACKALRDQDLGDVGESMTSQLFGFRTTARKAPFDGIDEEQKIAYEVKVKREGSKYQQLRMGPEAKANKEAWLADHPGYSVKTVMVIANGDQLVYVKEGIGSFYRKQMEHVATVGQDGKVTWHVLPEAKAPAVTQPAGLPKFNAGGKWDAAEMRKEEARLVKLLDKANKAETAEATKARIAKVLAKRLEKNGDWLDTVCKDEWSWSPKAPKNAEAVRELLRANNLSEEVIEERIQEAAQKYGSFLNRGWAGSSGDSNTLAIAMQLAAKDEFGLDAAAIGHFSKDALAEAAAFYEPRAAGLRAFLRAQYDETQEWLAKEGIEDVLVYRGSLFSEAEHAAVEAAGKRGMEQVGLQPMSSFTAEPMTAFAFGTSGRLGKGGGMYAVRVPRERILGSCQTGYGCKNEAEFVVLGGNDTVRVVTDWHDEIDTFTATRRAMQSDFVHATEAIP